MLAQRTPSWGRTRPVTADSGQRQATGTWVSGGAVHSCSESSAVELGEGQMGNVGLRRRIDSSMSVANCKSDPCNTDEGCELCGAPATVFECSVVIGESSSSSSSRALCKQCAKAAGAYPKLRHRLLGLAMFAAIWPFRGYLRRKYPPEYWQRQFDQLNREQDPGTSGRS